MNIITTISQFGDLLRQQFYALCTIAEYDRLIDLQLKTIINISVKLVSERMNKPFGIAYSSNAPSVSPARTHNIV
jgi:hypothetical protein